MNASKTSLHRHHHYLSYNKRYKWNPCLCEQFQSFMSNGRSLGPSSFSWCERERPVVILFDVRWCARHEKPLAYRCKDFTVSSKIYIQSIIQAINTHSILKNSYSYTCIGYMHVINIVMIGLKFLWINILEIYFSIWWFHSQSCLSDWDRSITTFVHRVTQRLALNNSSVTETW